MGRLDICPPLSTEGNTPYDFCPTRYGQSTTPLEEPLTVCIEFTLLKPKSVAKKRQHPSVEPDLDNLEKSVLDAINGLIYTDDALICHKYSVECYTTNASETMVSIDIKTMKGIA